MRCWRALFRGIAISCVLLSLAACGGGGGETAPDAEPVSYDLVFDSAGPDDVPRLYRADTSTGAIAAIAGGIPGYRPSADPQGDRLVFAAKASQDPLAKYSLRLLELANGVQSRLSIDDEAIEAEAGFAPDGVGLVYTSDRDNGDSDIIHARLISGVLKDVRNLTAPPSSLYDEDRTPAWSPDGSRIAFTAYRSGSPTIWIMNADGTMLRQITVAGNWGDFSPSWSADGRTLAFQRVDIVDGLVRSRIGRVPVAGGAVEFFNFSGSVYDPRYSPDGKYIAFWAKSDDGGDIYVADLSGQILQRLATPGADRHAAWIRRK